MATVNLTPDQIHAEFKKTKGLRIKELLKNSYIPEELVVEYIDRLYPDNADWGGRSEQIIDMFKRNNVKISIETLEVLCEKYYHFANTDGISEIFDFNALNASITDEDFFADDYYNISSPLVLILISFVLHNPSNLSPELLERMYKCNKYVSDNWKRKHFEALTPELKDVMRKHHPIDNMSRNPLRNVILFHLYDTIDLLKSVNLFELEEMLSGNYSENVIDNRAIRDSIKASPEMMDIFIDKVLNESPSNIELKRSGKFIKHMINEHERKDEVLDYITPVLEKVHAIPFDEVDWHSLGNKLQDMTIEERQAWFSRKDVPVWFLNENSGVMMHLMMYQSNNEMPIPLSHMMYDRFRGFNDPE